MKTYKFYIDRKYTEWDRAHYEVEAASEEEAKSLAMQIMEQSREEEVEPVCYETIDSIVDMTPEENKGYATKELYFDGEMVADNAIIKSFLNQQNDEDKEQHQTAADKAEPIAGSPAGSGL